MVVCIGALWRREGVHEPKRTNLHEKDNHPTFQLSLTSDQPVLPLCIRAIETFVFGVPSM